MSLKKIAGYFPDTRDYVCKPMFFEQLGKIHPQFFQNFAIGFLLLFGGKFLGFVEIRWIDMLAVFASITIFDFLCHYFFYNKKIIPLSAINSGIGICFFLRTAVLPIYVFAAIVAILTKHLVRIKGRHFLNPSYTAVLVCWAMFPIVAYTNPVQWSGGGLWILAVIAAVGSIVMMRVGLFDVVLTYFLTFFLWLNLFTTYTFGDLQVLFLTGSFFIVAFFGLTDPAILPKKRLHRLMYVVQASMLFFICRLFLNENYSILIGYVIVTVLEIPFWHLESRQFMKFNARTFWQSLTTVVIFVAMAGLSINYYLKHDHIWPEILTNRCLELVCQWEPDI